MKQFDDGPLVRHYAGLIMDERVWAPTVPTRNRDGLLEGGTGRAFFTAVVEQIRAQTLLPDSISHGRYRAGGLSVAKELSAPKRAGRDASDDDFCDPEVGSAARNLLCLA